MDTATATINGITREFVAKVGATEPEPKGQKRSVYSVFVAHYMTPGMLDGDEDASPAIQAAIKQSVLFAQRRYETATVHPKAPTGFAGSREAWSRSASAKCLPVILPPGNLRVENSIQCPASVPVEGAPGWHTSLEFFNASSWQVVGSHEAEFGPWQNTGGCLKNLKIVPHGPVYSAVLILGDLQNWEMNNVHIMNTNNPDGFALNHLNYAGQSNIRANEVQLVNGVDPQLKECTFMKLQIEGGKAGMLLRGLWNSTIAFNKILYCDHGMHLHNMRESTVESNRISWSKPGSGEIGMTACGGHFDLNGNRIRGYDHGLYLSHYDQRHSKTQYVDPMIFADNRFIDCRSATTNSQFYRKPPEVGLIPSSQNLWGI